MVEKETFAGVERRDRGHVLVVEFKVEDVEILPHTFDMNRFRNYDHPALHEPAECHLSHAFAVFVTDSFEHWIGEEVVAAFGQWSLRHYLSAGFFHIFLSLDLLVEHVGLDLIDHRSDLHVCSEVYEMVGVEVADADGADFTLAVGIFESAVCAIAVAERLMEQHEVDIIRAQAAEAFVD